VSYVLLAGGSASAPTTVARPLIGPVRVMPGGYLGDDTGYRRILLNHDFPLLNRWVFDEAEAKRGVEATARAGFQGSRIMHLVSDDRDIHDPDPNNYWQGREVTKAIFRAAAVPALSYMRSFGLRVILTAGHEYRDRTDEYGWWDELTGILRDGGVADVVLWPEALGNEVGINRPWLANNTPAAMAYVKPIQDIIRRNLGTLVSNGDFGEETDLPNPDKPWQASLCGPSEGADLTDIHPRRHMPDSVRYPHTIWYATHYFGTCRKPTSEGEEPGENAPYYENKPWLPRNPGGDTFNGCDDPTYLFTRLAIDQMTGQATCYLNGPGVRRFAPLDSTIYFDRIAGALNVLPEDIATWQGDHNPSFFNRGKEFVYVGLLDWNQIDHPPHPVEEWTFYDINGVVDWDERQSHAEVPKGWLGGVVKGTYA